jgi:hypothetical protein
VLQYAHALGIPEADALATNYVDRYRRAAARRPAIITRIPARSGEPQSLQAAGEHFGVRAAEPQRAVAGAPHGLRQHLHRLVRLVLGFGVDGIVGPTRRGPEQVVDESERERRDGAEHTRPAGTRLARVAE